MAAGNAALPALIANLAVELAPIRVNLIAAGFVDSPLSASLLGGDLDKRRAQLRATLPIGRVVEPADVAALAVHIMTNTALTGATYDIDGGATRLGSMIEMNDLLKLAIEGHGGLRRWEQISRFRVAVSITGAIWALKGKPGRLELRRARGRDPRPAADRPRRLPVLNSVSVAVDVADVTFS